MAVDEPNAVREVQRLKRKCRLVIASGAVLTVTGLFAFGSTNMQGVFGLGLSVFVVGVLLTLVGVVAHRKVVKKAFAVNTPEGIGLLSDMLAWGLDTNPIQNQETLAAITVILPQMTAEHRHILTRRQARSLYRRIDHRTIFHDRGFLLALAQSLSRTRDWRALPFVEAYLRRKPAGFPELVPVTEALRACLPILEAEKERESGKDALLRPAAVGGTEVLMRPAGSAEVEEGVLLRESSEEP